MFHALEKFNKKEALKELRMRKATPKVQMKPIAVIALSQSLVYMLYFFWKYPLSKEWLIKSFWHATIRVTQ